MSSLQLCFLGITSWRGPKSSSHEAGGTERLSRVRAGLRGAGRAGIQQLISLREGNQQETQGKGQKNTTVLTGRKVLGKEKSRSGETCPVTSMTPGMKEAVPWPSPVFLDNPNRLLCELRAGCEQPLPRAGLQGSSVQGLAEPRWDSPLSQCGAGVDPSSQLSPVV